MFFRLLEQGSNVSRQISRLGLLLVMLLPLWALWFYSYASLTSLQGDTARLPYFYGMHLYKTHLRVQLEQLAATVDLMDLKIPAAGTEDPGNAFPQEELEQMARAFGLNTPLFLVQQGEARLLYPTAPTEDLAAILDDPDREQALLDALERLTSEGSQEGYFSLDTEDLPLPSGRMQWFLSVISAEDGIQFLLLVPEEALRKPGGILQAAHEALLREHLQQYLWATLPVLIFTSLLTGLLYYKRQTYDIKGPREGNR